MERKMMLIKEWVIEKAQREARRYNIYIDLPERTDDDLRTVMVHDGGYVSVVAEVIAETEKAVKVRLQSGDVGSADGWMTWIPKSQIAA